MVTRSDDTVRYRMVNRGAHVQERRATVSPRCRGHAGQRRRRYSPGTAAAGRRTDETQPPTNHTRTATSGVRARTGAAVCVSSASWCYFFFSHYCSILRCARHGWRSLRPTVRRRRRRRKGRATCPPWTAAPPSVIDRESNSCAWATFKPLVNPRTVSPKKQPLLLLLSFCPGRTRGGPASARNNPADVPRRHPRSLVSR